MRMLRNFRAVVGVAAIVAVVVLCGASAKAQGPGAAAAAAPEGDAINTAIKEQAQKMSRAFMSEDFEVFFDATYPKIIELAGGRAAMLADLKKEVARWRAQNVKVLAYEVGGPGDVSKAGTKLFSVVPVELKMEVPGAVFTQKSFLLAVSTDGGKVWKFIDGTTLDKDKLKLLVPEASEVVSLPKAEDPTIERKP